MINLAKSPGRTALQQGLLFGLILAALIIILDGIVSLTGLSVRLTLTLNRGGHMSLNQAVQMASFLIYAPVFILSVVIYFIVGWRASRLMGKTSTGVLAGLWTGLVMSVLVSIIDIAFLFLVKLPAALKEYSASHIPVSSSFTASQVSSTLISSLEGLLLALVLGAGIGVLGGLLGKDQNGRMGNEQRETARIHLDNEAAGQPDQPV